MSDKPKIVARFYVAGFEKQAGGNAVVRLQAATSKENARWAQYTPSGQITMDLTRKASGARDGFEAMVGEECLVTFDFAVSKGEMPEYRGQGTPDELGFISDEEKS